MQTYEGDVDYHQLELRESPEGYWELVSLPVVLGSLAKPLARDLCTQAGVHAEWASDVESEAGEEEGSESEATSTEDDAGDTDSDGVVLPILR